MVEGPIPLSDREQQILKLVATGATNQQIACELTISVNTVKVHLRNIFTKIGVESRTEASMWAVQHGVVAIAGLPVGDEGAASAAMGGASASGSQALASETAARAEPIPFAKRVAFVVGALLTLALAFFPVVPSLSSRADTQKSNPFSDHSAAPTDQMLVLSPRWSSRAPMPSTRARLAVVALDGLVYAIGGDVSGAVVTLNEAYSPEQNAWQSRAAKPTAVSNVGAVAVGGLIYVPGGMLADGHVTDVFETYDPVKDVWAALKPLPQPLCAYAIAALDSRIYLFGGWDGQHYLDTVRVYETLTGAWSVAAPMPIPRAFAAASSIGNKIYVVGGYDEIQEFALCQEYDPARQDNGGTPWRERAPMNLPRAGLAVATAGDSLYAIGGGWQNYLAYNERYDPHSNAWFSFESPVVGQWRNLGAATVGVNLYAVGGWNGEYLNINEEYQVLYRLMLPIQR